VRADLDWRFQGCISCSAPFDLLPKRQRMDVNREKGRRPRDSGCVRIPRTGWAFLCTSELPVYRRYENSLHVASKEESRIRHMPTFGLINRSYIRCFRRTHKVCLVINNYTRGIPGSSQTQKSTSGQLYN